MRVDASGLSFKELNELIRTHVRNGAKRIELVNVNGQRYISDGLSGELELIVHGTAGNDLGAFMNGPIITVYGDVGDGAGNTMNKGKIVVHGHAGDVIGYSMRGGEILIKGNAGYRVGIHMKEYLQSIPVIVVGGLARDFLGEYMAGGRIVVLGLNADEEPVGDYIGTGMHGGVIYVRGKVEEDKLGVGARTVPVSEEDWAELKLLATKYSEAFGEAVPVAKEEFTKVVPLSHRPYERTYALTTTG
jgi:glutamate synthase domain-containing protein 3